MIKKEFYKKSQYFPKPYRSFGGNIDAYRSFGGNNFAPKSNLPSLKTEVDKLDTDKLKPVPVDLSKLYHIIKNDVVKKTVYNKLVAKVNNVDSSRFVLKTKYKADKWDLEKNISDSEKKVPDTSVLLKKQIIMLKLVK